VDSGGDVTLVRKAVWHDTPEVARLRFLERIAVAGTRSLNRQWGVTFEDVLAERRRASSLV
jgi:hypothetical protein